MNITIDQSSGCCFGVVSAISAAEELLNNGKPLYCLGDIVHNNQELERLSKMGLIYINDETFEGLTNCTVLIRGAW
jgi:4-hydroxy-3-methylbut-2-en-1-yl diphosphate reductase